MKKILPYILVIALGLGGAYYFVIQNEAQPTTTTTVEDAGEVKTIFNENTSSEIALILSAYNGEGVVVTRKLGVDSEQIDKVILFGAGGRSAVATANKNGLAERYEDDEGNVITYENYTNKTVDLTFTEANGTVTKLDEYEHGLDLSGSLASLIIPEVHADEEYYYGATGLFLNSVGCAATIVGSPFGPLSCTIVVARLGGLVVSQVVEIDGCVKGEELVDCALNKYKNYSERKIIRGLIRNKTTNTPISGATLSLKNRTGKETGETITLDDGAYDLAITGDVSTYTLSILKEGHEDLQVGIVESGKKLRVTDETGATITEKKLTEENQFTLWHDFHLSPDFGVIRGEVIDSETGLGVKDARISLSPLGLKATSDSDGEFVMFPNNVKDKTTVTVTASATGYVTKTLSLNLLAIIDEGDHYRMMRGESIFNRIIKLDPEKEEEKDDEEKEEPEEKEEEPKKEDEKPKEPTEPVEEKKEDEPKEEEPKDEVPTVIEKKSPEFDGKYTEPFDRSDLTNHNEQGVVLSIAERSFGTITVTVTGDQAECHIDLTSNFSTAMDNQALGDGVAYMSPSKCSGNVSQDGKFNLSGTLTGEVSVAGQTVQESGPFTVVGQIQDDQMWGEILAPDVAPIPFGNKPTEVKGFDGNWLGISVDTSGKESCSGEQFNVTVSNNEASGFFSGKIDDSGKFTIVGSDKNGDRVIYEGEFGATHAEGIYTDPFKSSCEGTFTMQRQ